MQVGNPTDYTMPAARLGAEAAIVGGLIGGLLSGIFQLIRDWWTQPKLVLEFDPDIDKFETVWGGEVPFNGINLRVSIRNEGRRPAQNTRVFVASIDAIHASGNTRSLRDSRQICWAGWSFEPRSVQRGITFYVDFVRVSKDASGWHFTFRERMANDGSLEGYRGIYRFRLVAVADNANPCHLNVDVEYQGDWHNLKAWKPAE